MAIYQDSRYERADVVALQGPDGVYHATIVPGREPVPISTYTVHRFIQGDSLPALADTAYGDAEYWWLIADANPGVLFPEGIPPGTLLRIPVLGN